MAKEMKLLKLGNVCLDGTKIEANASRHSARSHGHIEKLEAQLKAEVQALFALAEQADQADVPDGVSLPEEIKRREDRLAAMSHRLKTTAGRALYALRKQTVEPVFGIIKSVMGFRRFSLRGLRKVRGATKCRALINMPYGYVLLGMIFYDLDG